MSDIVIDIEDLGKRYALSRRHRPDSLKSWLQSLVRQSRTTSPHPSADEEFWALKNVSLQVRQGECLALVGRNGSGKSTLLKILSRIIPPSQGRARVRGRVASLLEVGTGFHPELTGRENIYLNGAMLGCPERDIRRRFDAIVDFSGVERFLDTPVKHYSSGMYVRLAYSVAAHVDADILIIDEVLAVGDGDFKQKCLSHLGTTLASGKSAIMVSHDLMMLEALSSHVAWLRDGHLLEVAPIKSDLLRRYAV
ncbi:MAG: Teichoic acids export ATP-binding protein TagH [Candidatus Accumulibacter sp. BA-94]|jgi:lipopolysaccharide transport system ATP-binding protein|uniref:ABC transporter ATP-binding protein n=1 Tax=Accumulibacter sp. TaxID=2053492 RepID=UPI00044CF375|nr:ABC transporter ATP-binding protein [Accumulibacter sp.]EXI83880.1 MAG: Teichoic acids export ATP-binding protein TagH [Candidatus Accumulibacter sp. BA-94]HRD86878.1 ABC transporter ATP-binding protein [Accumulibacter sp.]